MATQVKQPDVIAFSSLTASERRVRICRDVLNALRRKRMEARKISVGESFNPYVDIHELLGHEGPSPSSEMDARQYIQKKCTVCAKGALLIACIDRFDKVKLNELNKFGNSGSPYVRFELHERSPSSKWLRRFFGHEQLLLMEMAFEMSCDAEESSSDLMHSKYELCMKAVAFGKRNKRNADKRLSSIMRNVIRNEGTFVP